MHTVLAEGFCHKNESCMSSMVYQSILVVKTVAHGATFSHCARMTCAANVKGAEVRPLQHYTWQSRMCYVIASRVDYASACGIADVEGFRDIQAMLHAASR